MNPASLGLKVAKPVLLAGYREFRHELARRRGDAAATLTDLGDVSRVLDEALGVLARDSGSLVDATKDWLKAQVSLPDLFRETIPQRWVATERAQQALRAAAIAAIRGEDEEPHAQVAIDHYQTFLDEGGTETAPDAADVYVEALDFLLRSLKRALTLGETVLITKLDGMMAEMRRAQPLDTGEIVDSHLRSTVARLRRARFFRSAKSGDQAKLLASEILDGRSRGASPAARAVTLSWCIRLHAFDNTPLAREWLDRVLALGTDQEEVLLAKAFVAAGERDWKAGIRLLDPGASPAQATAILQIMRHGLGTEPGIEQAAKAGIDLAELDGDGRYALITGLVETGQWSNALVAVQRLDPADYALTPALLWVAATVLVANSLPADLRGAVLQDIPSNPAYFPLPDDETSIERRREARMSMMRAAKQCEELGLPLEAQAAGRYALWLDLRDPARSEEALADLRDRMDVAEGGLDFLAMALSFGLPVNRTKAERAIERRLALHPEPSPEMISAIVSLLIDHAARGDAQAAADFLLRYRALLAEYLEQSSFLSLQVKIFMEAGRTVDAEAVLAAQESANVSAATRALLDSGIAGGDGEPSIETLEAAYREDRQTTTLMTLLRRYEALGVGARYVEVARELLTRVPSADLANDILVALRRAGQEGEALELLDVMGDAVQQSEPLLGHAAYLYFRRGRLADADRALSLLEARRDHENDRTLRYQMLVASGDWEGVDAFLDVQWQRRADRTGLELVQLANLAAQVQVKRKRIEDFIHAAVEAAPDVPEVLMGAYTAATSAGIEDAIPNAFQWITRAAELSNEDGPVRRGSIQELLAGQPAWEERVGEATKAQVTGTAPLELIARMVHRSWLDLHLAPLVTNPRARDPREQILVVPFSGWRRIDGEETLAARTISVDRTALVTLAFTGMLADVFGAVDRVFVTHDVLADLFVERARLSFHQPSKVTFARHLSELVSNGTVRAFAPVAVPDLGLVTEIGQSRAALLVEAAAHEEGQHLVVHPYPITRVGSFLADPVPLDAYRAHLCSCGAIIDALARQGRLTQAATDSAHAYLAAHEERWPGEPVVTRGATLYLTDLSVSYLRYVGVLDRIADAGMTVIVSHSELDEARALLDIQARAADVDRVIDRLREAMIAGLAQGKLMLDAAPVAASEEAMMSAVWGSLIARSDVLVCDDRFINRYANFDHGEGRTRILSSLDLLELLTRCGHIAPARLAEAHTLLRGAGAAFVPASADELTSLLAQTQVASDLTEEDDEGSRPLIRETAELRAFRENIRLVQARGWFDPQFDSPWLLGFSNTLASALYAQWQPAIADDLARARSTWLLGLLDMRNWADNLGGGDREELSERGIVLDLVKLATVDTIASSERERFDAWFEQDVLAPLWRRQPQLRQIFLNHLRGLITAVSSDMAQKHDDVSLHQLARMSFDRLPDFLQLELLEVKPFRDLVGYGLSPALNVGDTSFPRPHVIEAVTALYAARHDDQEIRDVHDVPWTLSTDPADPVWPLRFGHGGKGWQVRGMIGLHPTPVARIAMMDGVLDAYGLARSVLDPWRTVLSARRLEADEIDAVDAVLRDLPAVAETIIRDSLSANAVAISELVPGERAYYEYLVGANETATLNDYLIAPNRLRHLDWVPEDPGTRACWALLLAAHPRALVGQLDTLTDEDWRGLGRWACDGGDLLAKVGFIELALPRAHADPELEAIVIELSREIEALDPKDQTGPLHLLSSLVIFVDGELSVRRVLADWPPFRRRMAAFAQASLIARVVQGQINTATFADFCAKQRGWRFAVQSMVDLRREPRWRPDYISPDQLRHEFIGRIANIAGGLPAEQLTKGLRARFIAKRGSLRARLAYPMAFWPGPLEGGVNADLHVAGEELCASIDEALAQEPPGIDALTRLIVVGAMLRLPPDLVERAVERVRTTGPKILAPLPPERIGFYLLGLAHVAAAARLPELADTVRVFARFHRAHSGVVAQEDMQLGLFLAAANEDPTAWRRSVGSWTLELTREVKDETQAGLLLNWIEALCDVDPPLRAWIVRARANLKLFLNG